MPEKIIIEVFRNMDADTFTKSLADSESRLHGGCISAYSAACAASLCHRVASVCTENADKSDRVEYIVRNTEIIRDYMIHLIDENVRCRAPLRKALREADDDKIEASRHAAVAIDSEIINMMTHILDFLNELLPLCPVNELPELKQSAILAFSSMQCSKTGVLGITDLSADDTYRFVSRRENELIFDKYAEIYHSLIEQDR